MQRETDFLQTRIYCERAVRKYFLVARSLNKAEPWSFVCWMSTEVNWCWVGVKNNKSAIEGVCPFYNHVLYRIDWSVGYDFSKSEILISNSSDIRILFFRSQFCDMSVCVSVKDWLFTDKRKINQIKRISFWLKCAAEITIHFSPKTINLTSPCSFHGHPRSASCRVFTREFPAWPISIYSCPTGKQLISLQGGTPLKWSPLVGSMAVVVFKRCLESHT